MNNVYNFILQFKTIFHNVKNLCVKIEVMQESQEFYKRNVCMSYWLLAYYELLFLWPTYNAYLKHFVSQKTLIHKKSNELIIICLYYCAILSRSKLHDNEDNL